MTEVRVNLPDSLAKEAAKAGLLKPKAIEKLLREQLRKQAGQELRVMMNKLAAAKIPRMTEDEVQAEIDAVRRTRRAGRRP